MHSGATVSFHLPTSRSIGTGVDLEDMILPSCAVYIYIAAIRNKFPDLNIPKRLVL